MKTVCEELEELAEQRGDHALGESGIDGESWMLIDFVDVVVHVFSQEARMYYDLDGLWGDAPRVTWERADGKKADE